MEKLTITTFNGNDYISKKDLLKFLAEISDAVNTFSDRGDPIRAEGANKVISLLLEQIIPTKPWKPSEEQMNGLAHAINLDVYDAKRYGLDSLYNDLKKLM